MSVILAGDVGGTKTAIGCFLVQGGKLTSVAQRTVPTADYSGLEAIVQDFLADHPGDLAGACFGVAAPVVDGRSEPTNLPWTVDTQTLQCTLALEHVWVINDMEAMAYGIEMLPMEMSVVLQAGKPQPKGTIAVIAAGTSLGEAMMVWDGRRYQALASEGGHADFAPRNALELELCRYLFGVYGHVSYARLLSGPGLVHIYRFLKERGEGEETSWLADQFATGEASALITKYALAGHSELCVKALACFVSIYGAEAGNLALRTLPRGGIYLGGGIAPKILHKLTDGTFMRAFLDKGRLASLLSTIPVRVIVEDKAALYGAAQYGWSLATSM